MTKNFTLAENITTENNQNFIVNRECPTYKVIFRLQSNDSTDLKKVLRDEVPINIGEFYNSISSRFEVPVDGVYMFTINAGFIAGIARIELRINDNVKSSVFKNNLEEVTPINLTSIEQCQRGDFVEYYYRGIPDQGNTFIGTGHLLG
jgi:hypothetical protein